MQLLDASRSAPLVLVVVPPATPAAAAERELQLAASRTDVNVLALSRAAEL